MAWLAGTGLGSGTTGKLGRAWVGAWVHGGGDVEMMLWGWVKCHHITYRRKGKIYCTSQKKEKNWMQA